MYYAKQACANPNDIFMKFLIVKLLVYFNSVNFFISTFHDKILPFLDNTNAGNGTIFKYLFILYNIISPKEKIS